MLTASAASNLSTNFITASDIPFKAPAIVEPSVSQGILLIIPSIILYRDIPNSCQPVSPVSGFISDISLTKPERISIKILVFSVQNSPTAFQSVSLNKPLKNLEKPTPNLSQFTFFVNSSIVDVIVFMPVATVEPRLVQLNSDTNPLSISAIFLAHFFKNGCTFSSAFFADSTTSLAFDASKTPTAYHSPFLIASLRASTQAFTTSSAPLVSIFPTFIAEPTPTPDGTPPPEPAPEPESLLLLSTFNLWKGAKAFLAASAALFVAAVVFFVASVNLFCSSTAPFIASLPPL